MTEHSIRLVVATFAIEFESIGGAEAVKGSIDEAVILRWFRELSRTLNGVASSMRLARPSTHS